MKKWNNKIKLVDIDFRKITVFLIIFIWFQPSLIAQNALTMLKFEQAEQAFNNGNYTKVLQHLDEVEKQAGVTSKTLYLRVVSENKLFNDGEQLYDDESQFRHLSNLRKHAKTYLDALSKQGLDDRYREIYRIAENLEEYPQTKTEWLSQKVNYWEKIKAEKLRQIQAEKVEAKRIKDQEYDQLYNNVLSINSAKYHVISKISADSLSGQTATVYFVRPNEGTKDMVQSLLINEKVVEEKFKLGESLKYYFSPGLIKVGQTDAENKRRMKKGNAILMGGVIGLVATSGKIVAKNESPFFLEVLAGKTYYISSLITDDKTILYELIDEDEAKPYLSADHRQ